VDVLRGGGPADLKELCIELAGWMLHLGGAADTVEQGKTVSRKLLASGEAFEKFRQMVILQGGDARAIEEPARLPHSKFKLDVESPKDGFIVAIDCEAMGRASVVLGGGREKKEDSVDPAVGIVVQRKLGERVSAREPLCTIHHNSEARAAQAARLLLESYQIASTPPAGETPPLIRHIIRGAAAK
jgi:thymidine phosphorylase